MKIGLKRVDSLRGTGYAVSAHLLEGDAAEDIRVRFPEVKKILVKNGEEPEKLGITPMLSRAGYEVALWDGTVAAQSADGASSAVLTVGDVTDMSKVQDLLLGMGEEQRPIHLWWMTSPAGAFMLPPEGVTMPELALCDPTLFTEEMWEAAHVHAARLGVLLDKDLFAYVYSSYDPVTLCTRGCRLVQDLVLRDAGNVRTHLLFGEVMAQVIDRVTGCEMTRAEALSIGMVYEVALGAKLGACTRRKLADLEGLFTYRGLPTAVDATGGELAEAFESIYAGRDHVILSLPTAIGRCRAAEYAVRDVARLIRENL